MNVHRTNNSSLNLNFIADYLISCTVQLIKYSAMKSKFDEQLIIISIEKIFFSITHSHFFVVPTKHISNHNDEFLA